MGLSGHAASNEAIIHSESTDLSGYDFIWLWIKFSRARITFRIYRRLFTARAFQPNHEVGQLTVYVPL